MTPSGCFAPAVSMVKTPDPRQRDNLGRGGRAGLGLSSFGGVADRGVDSLGVVVVDVLAQEPSQVVFAKHDDVIQELATYAAYEALGGTVLPWALEGRSLWSQTETLDRACDLNGEDRIVVEDQETMCWFVWEGIPKLLNHPAGCGALGHVEVENASPAVVDHEPHVEQAGT